MAIAKLQRCLERLYDVSVSHDVEDFLIHDAGLTRQLETSLSARAIPEKLLLHETEDGLDIALFLERELVERLRRDDPTERLHAGNLGDFLTALEGVSHFLYLVWSARYERRVSLLELELQAEIDKFILAAMLLARGRAGCVPAGLHQVLFDEVWLDPALDTDLRERYRDANRYARRYCAWLQRRFMTRRCEPGMMSELRRFYRLGHHDKLSRIRHQAPH
jgi:hypothetical protein